MLISCPFLKLSCNVVHRGSNAVTEPSPRLSPRSGASSEEPALPCHPTSVSLSPREIISGRIDSLVPRFRRRSCLSGTPWKVLTFKGFVVEERRELGETGQGVNVKKRQINPNDSSCQELSK